MDSKESQPNSEETQTTETSAIFIGKKPIKNYIGSINLQLNELSNSEVIIKARGKFISKAVDIAELAKRKEDFDIDIKDIKIDTERYTKEDENEIKVSTIEIKLSKK